jgi:hypothetical protein
VREGDIYIIDRDAERERPSIRVIISFFLVDWAVVSEVRPIAVS